MAKFFKPRRGNLAMATSLLKGENKLKSGEIFFECPDSGIGTGTGKLKMGDGVSDYDELPYFMDGHSGVEDVSTAAVEFSESSSSAYDTLLNEIASGNAVMTIIGAEKKMLRKLYGDVTQLNNDIVTIDSKIADLQGLVDIFDISGPYPVLDFGSM